MPTIPRFHVTQDAIWVFVRVHVPYVRVSEMEFYVDGTHFSFFCKPYLLKLQFPHEVVDDELAKAVYDPNKDHGTIVVHLPKKEPGQEFEDLDMLTKLLQPKEPKIDIKLDAKKNTPLIEVLNSSVSSEADAATDGGAEPADIAAQAPSTEPKKATASLLDLEERIAVTPAEPETVRITNLKPTYGFNNAYSDFFRVWHGEVSEILSLPDPENTPADQRRVLREAGEDEQFDVERYLLDFINKGDDMYYQLAMEYEPFWKQQPVVVVKKNSQPEPVKVIQEVKKSPLIMEVVSSTTSSNSAPENQVTTQMNALEINGDSASSSPSSSSLFSEADRELLLRLPHKEYLIERGSKQEAVIFGGLVDILIGFTYDHLTSQGDSGIESTWAVSIVSPTLAWLNTTDDLGAVVRTAVRRILSFPFLRQYDLAMHVLKETVEILKRGKRVALRALLELHRVVEKSEAQYLLNTLYVQDYCVWIQSVQDEQLLLLSERLASHIASFKKADSGWALEEIERSVLEAEEDAEDSSEDEEEESSSDDESSDDDSYSEEEEEDEEEKAKEKDTQHYAMDGEEVRAALPTGDASSSWKLKLPFLCARPGNVGVQIDSYRAMKAFNRPRCGKFTEHFLGMQYENSSMENYSRVVERTSKRARIVEDRLAKLQAREQEILDDEQNRLRKRHEREVARQRKSWLHHQSLKKREQRQREQAAASVIQRCVRGMLARRERDIRLQEQMHDKAARTLQKSSKSFLSRRCNRKHALEKEKERQMQAATVLQRQTRKRLALAARKRLVKLDVPDSHRHPSPEKRDVLSASPDARTNPQPRSSPVKNPQPPELGRNISLDLLFSDDEEEESPMPSLVLTEEIRFSLPQAAASEAKQVSPRPTHQLKRPVSIKRVGGGFRATSFTPTKSPVPTRAYAPQQPQQPPRRVVRSQHVAAAATAKQSTQSHPLSLTSRRPSVLSSPPGGGSSSSTGGNAPRRRSSADGAQQATCDLLFDNDVIFSYEPPLRQLPAPAASATTVVVMDSTNDNELALEELLEVYARSHVADSEYRPSLSSFSSLETFTR